MCNSELQFAWLSALCSTNGQRCTTLWNGQRCTTLWNGQRCTTLWNEQRCTTLRNGQRCTTLWNGQRCTTLWNGQRCSCLLQLLAVSLKGLPVPESGEMKWAWNPSMVTLEPGLHSQTKFSSQSTAKHFAACSTLSEPSQITSPNTYDTWSDKRLLIIANLTDNS